MSMGANGIAKKYSSEYIECCGRVNTRAATLNYIAELRQTNQLLDYSLAMTKLKRTLSWDRFKPVQLP